MNHANDIPVCSSAMYHTDIPPWASRWYINLQCASPTSVLGKIKGKLKIYSINKLLKDRNIINASQHNSVENKPCQTNPLLFFDEISS